MGADSQTALHLAARYDHSAVVVALLSLRTALDAAYQMDRRPVKWCAYLSRSFYSISPFHSHFHLHSPLATFPCTLRLTHPSSFHSLSLSITPLFSPAFLHPV